MPTTTVTRIDRAWDVLPSPPKQPWWTHARRIGIAALAFVVLASGTLSIVKTVTTLVAPSDTHAPPRIADRAFDGVAVPFAVDYLSWDENDRAGRQAALAPFVAHGVTVDGWTGTGRQWADSPTPIGIARRGADHAVVTVRARVVPFAVADDADKSRSVGDEVAGAAGSAATNTPRYGGPTQPPRDPATEDRTGNTASGPVPGAAGWVAQRPRWLNLAVPLGIRGSRVVVTAIPVLVGSPPARAGGPAVPEAAAADDPDFAQRTRGMIDTLLGSYGSGDLGYARAAGTSFTGLDAGAELREVTAWRVAPAARDSDGSTRAGDVSVTWELAGMAGRLACTYRVDLRRDADRWYLAAIGPPTEAPA